VNPRLLSPAAALLAAAALGAFAPAAAQESAADPLALARLKDYSAFRVSSNNPDLSSNDDSKRPIPGQSIVLADLEGPGVVTHIWLTIAGNEYAWPRLLRLQVFYDGSPTASVDAPVGDFFGVGLGEERDINSAMVRNASSGRARNSYWPMPFRKRCRIVLTNEGRRRVSNVYYHVDWRKTPALPADVAYFHAHYRQELPTARGRRYTFLDVRGRGHYVGTVLSVIQNEPGWFGEGDEFFYVDGAAKPSIEGTGTEDYFNDAWSLRESSGPYFGVPIAQGTGLGSRMCAYRWHTPDPVPFTRSLRFEIEHAGWTYRADGAVRSAFEERADLFSSVAFWYQQGVADDLPEVPYGPARLPHGNALQIEVEKSIAEVKAENGAAEVQKEVFWSRDLLFLNAKGPGAKMHVPFDVADDGEYELLAQIAHAPDYGVYDVLLDGKPIASDVRLEHEPGANLGGAEAIDAWHHEIYVAVDHTLGWKKLARGRHTLTFVCAGRNLRAQGYNLGVDTLILARLGKLESTGGARAASVRRSSDAAALRAALHDSDAWVRQAAAWRLTQAPRVAAAASADLVSALRDSDAVVRGLAALALAGSPAALPALTASLRDPDVNVRLASAETISTFGRAARPALDALIAAADTPGEHVHVQRSVAKALGEIGPDAARAVPVLEKLRRIPRVEWAAAAALRKIRP
jgi:hypothetical protein